MARRFGDYDSDDDIIATGASPPTAGAGTESQLYYDTGGDPLKGGKSVGVEGALLRSTASAWQVVASPPDQVWFKLLHDRDIIVPSGQWVPIPFAEVGGANADMWSEFDYGSPASTTLASAANNNTLGGSSDPGGDNTLHLSSATGFTTPDVTASSNENQHTTAWVDILFPETRPGGVYRGTHDVANNPTSYPDGTGVNSGDWYVATSAGNIDAGAGGGTTYKIGDYITASTGTPTNDNADWGKTVSVSHIVEYTAISTNDLTCVGTMSEGTLKEGDVVRQAACNFGHLSSGAWNLQFSIGISCPTEAIGSVTLAYDVDTEIFSAFWAALSTMAVQGPSLTADDTPFETGDSVAYQMFPLLSEFRPINDPAYGNNPVAWVKAYQNSGETLKIVRHNAISPICNAIRDSWLSGGDQYTIS